jgi:hypothetical protein
VVFFLSSVLVPPPTSSIVELGTHLHFTLLSPTARGLPGGHGTETIVMTTLAVMRRVLFSVNADSIMLSRQFLVRAYVELHMLLQLAHGCVWFVQCLHALPHWVLLACHAVAHELLSYAHVYDALMMCK